ncbi:hypothetical protein [Kibdelosporangium philippinense]|uniref:hypothetical protein n=1 Tax=Kibdelosporangium philippinense TaxID=211113 RepID=UPI00361CB6C0
MPAVGQVTVCRRWQRDPRPGAADADAGTLGQFEPHGFAWTSQQQPCTERGGDGRWETAVGPHTLREAGSESRGNLDGVSDVSTRHEDRVRVPCPRVLRDTDIGYASTGPRLCDGF